jgi:hypothetical protein
MAVWDNRSTGKKVIPAPNPRLHPVFLSRPHGFALPHGRNIIHEIIKTFLIFKVLIINTRTLFGRQHFTQFALKRTT